MTTVSGWFTSLSTYIGGKVAELTALGRSIVDGLVAGVVAAGAALAAAAGGVVSGAIAAVRAALGNPHSPAPALIPLGSSISEGLAYGISQSAGLVVSAIQEVATSTEIAGIKEFTEALKSIAEAMAPAMAAIVMILAFDPGDATGLAAAVAKVAELVRIIVSGFTAANDQTDEALAAVGEFVSAGSSIVDLIGQSMGIMAQLAAITLPDVNGAMLENLARLRDFVASLVAGFGLAAVELSALSPIVKDFADAASSVIDLIEQALPAIAALYAVDLSKYTASYHLADQMIIFRKVIKELVKQFIDSAAEFSYMSDAVQSFTDAASSIVDLIAQALPVIAVLFSADLSKYVSSYHLADQMIIFRKVIKELVKQFIDSAAEFAFMSDAVQSFVAAAESVIGLIDQALPAIATLFSADLSKYVADYHLANQMVIFRKVIRELVNQFSMAAAEFSFMSDEVIRLADAAGSILDLLTQTMDVMGQVAGFTGFGGDISGRLTLLGEMLVSIVVTLANSLAAASAQSGAAITAAAALADSVGQLLDVVEAGVDALAALSTFAPIAGIQTAAMTFANQLVAVLQELAGAFSTAATNAGAAINQAAEFADQAADILDVVEPGLEALAALSTFVPIAGIREEARAFAYQLVAILRELAGEFSTAAANAGAAIAQAAEFADRAGDILDVIEPGLDALAALSTFVPIAGIRLEAMAFASQLVAVLQELAGAFSTAAVNAGAAITEAAEFADRAGDILDVVEPGLEALMGLASYVSTTGINAAVQSFAADLVLVVQALGTAFAAASTALGAAADQAASFADSAKDIVDVVEPGIEALSALAGYVSASGVRERTQQFAADLVTVITALANGLAASGLAANQAVTEAAALADKLTQILDVVKPGVEALAALADYTSGANLQAKTQQFTADLISVTQALVTGLTQSALAAGTALAQAGIMAQNISKLFEVIVPALEALEALAAYSAASDVRANAAQFTDDLVAVANTLVTGLNQAATSMGQGAIAAAQAFAAAVTGIVKEVDAAMNGLVALAGLPTPPIEPTLNYIVQSSQQITSSFSAAGDIGAAVVYAANFRLNLIQLVQEVQGAVAQIAALAGTSTSGSIGGALAAIANAMSNTVGQFSGAGQQLAAAFTEAIKTGIVAGAAPAAVSTSMVIGAAISAGTTVAKGGVAVGIALIAAITSGVSSGQNSVVNAVVQVVNAAISAGLNEAKKAGSIGQEVIRAALAEINAGRSSLDSAGSAAGSAIIDGMVRAISSGQSRLVNAIKAAVSAAVAAAKAALGIASPSKVALALMGNFMKTAAGALGDPRGLVSAVDQSMTRMVGVAAHRLAQSQLAAPVAMPMASLAGGISPRIYPMPETGSGRSIVTAGGGDFNLTININGGDHSLSDIKRQVQQAVSDAMAQQGRRADAVRRMR
ncbi:MAG: hypothetical protein H6663_14565 [Candidatus Promineofilum sp.]|nr:hypothetical protein [Promineifilum sp.]